MKKLAVLALAAFGLAPLTSHAYYVKCFDKQKIEHVQAGYVAEGPDSGDAIFIRLEDGRVYPMHSNYNLDTPRGAAIYQALMLALDKGHHVSGYDHFNSGCTRIDQIDVEKW